MMSKTLVGLLLILLGVGLVALGNAFTPLVSLSDAVHPLYFDGSLQLIFWDTDTGDWESDSLQAREFEHQFLCTASSVATEDGVGWLTAKHCVETNEDEVVLFGIPLWKEVVERDAFYIDDQPAQVVAQWGMWALLRVRGGEPSLSLDWPNPAPSVEIGEWVYSISYAEGAYDYAGTTELYTFFTRGRVEAIAPSGTNIIAALDAVPGNSGAPVFVERDGELVLIGTIEATFSSGKTRVELLTPPPSLELPSLPESLPVESIPSLPPEARWENWTEFPAWLQAAWAEVWEANATWASKGLECFSGRCYWGVGFDGGLIAYLDSATWIALPLRVQDAVWQNYVLYGADFGERQWRRG